MLSQRNFGELVVVVSSWHKFRELSRTNHDWFRDHASGEVYRQRRCLPFLFRVISVHAATVSWVISLSFHLGEPLWPAVWDTYQLWQKTKRKQEQRRRARYGTNPYGLPPLRRSHSCLRGGTTRPRQLHNRMSLANNEAGHGDSPTSRMATAKRHFRSYLRVLKTHDLMNTL